MHVVSDECVKCGACEATCPTGAITEGETKYVVGDACIDCGSCESVCPTGAIYVSCIAVFCVSSLFFNGVCDRIKAFRSTVPVSRGRR